MKLQSGSLGQFDVVADGKVIASKGGNLLKRMMGGGFPEAGDVVRAIEKLQQTSR